MGWKFEIARGWDDVRPPEVAELASRYAYRNHRGVMHWRTSSAGGGKIEAGEAVFAGSTPLINADTRNVEVAIPLKTLGRFLASLALEDAARAEIAIVKYGVVTEPATRPAAHRRAARDIADGLAWFLESVVDPATCTWAMLVARRETTGIPDAPARA